jgi:hypothetical protein
MLRVRAGELIVNATHQTLRLKPIEHVGSRRELLCNSHLLTHLDKNRTKAESRKCVNLSKRGPENSVKNYMSYKCRALAH